MAKTNSILIADGGSTKVDWVLLQNGQEVATYHTSGLNPFIVGIESMVSEIKESLVSKLGDKLSQEISAIHYL